jgi:hypothetical protein
MTTLETCPQCGRQLSQESSQTLYCPQCEPGALTNGNTPRGISPWLVVKVIIAGALGITPGAIYLAIRQPPLFALLIMVLGAFIALAFVLAKLSVRNVAGLTAGVLVSYNAPGFLREPIIDAFAGNGDDDPEKKQGSQKADVTKE